MTICVRVNQIAKRRPWRSSRSLSAGLQHADASTHSALIQTNLLDPGFFWGIATFTASSLKEFCPDPSMLINHIWQVNCPAKTLMSHCYIPNHSLGLHHQLVYSCNQRYRRNSLLLLMGWQGLTVQYKSLEINLWPHWCYFSLVEPLVSMVCGTLSRNKMHFSIHLL